MVAVGFLVEAGALVSAGFFVVAEALVLTVGFFVVAEAEVSTAAESDAALVDTGSSPGSGGTPSEVV